MSRLALLHVLGWGSGKRDASRAGTGRPGGSVIGGAGNS